MFPKFLMIISCFLQVHLDYFSVISSRVVVPVRTNEYCFIIRKVCRFILSIYCVIVHQLITH